jgi:hypothetical protein
MLVAFASAFVCAYLLLLYLTGDRRGASARAPSSTRSVRM